MSGGTMIFVVLGVATVCGWVMRVLDWLEG